MKELTVLHTSDWHLGHSLYKRRRDDEFAAFLRWLLSAIRENHVDALLVAGDVFDTPMPPVAAQKMYFDFLGKVAAAGARHVVITAGNHDSPAFLSAPAGLLRSFNIHVIGAAPEAIEDEVLFLRDAAGAPELLVCAVPYLRERDLAACAAGESATAREQALLAGMRAHYAAVAEHARAMREACGADIPIVGMGHLFAAGGDAGDGASEIYVGALGRVPADIFGEIFDYVALGHLHRAQKVAQTGHLRYSGSPLRMSFGENGQKSAFLIHFNGKNARTSALAVPPFRRMEQARGNRSEILERLRKLGGEAGTEKIWVEIQHDGSGPPGDLGDASRALTQGTNIEILCVKSAYRAAPTGRLARRIEEVTPAEMFQHLLRSDKVAGAEAGALTETFRLLLAEFAENAREV